ncbi:MAG TPA: hypothetical protein VHW23_25000 [Kofleriaceae bacterium]|jgi:hypothetical protein|nr:hypothetical protein [Kofleriaceae bacterium]
MRHSDEFEISEDIETRERPSRPPSFGHRHGLKVLGGVLAVMFVTVIVAQVAC